MWGLTSAPWGALRRARRAAAAASIPASTRRTAAVATSRAGSVRRALRASARAPARRRRRCAARPASTEARTPPTVVRAVSAAPPRRPATRASARARRAAPGRWARPAREPTCAAAASSAASIGRPGTAPKPVPTTTTAALAASVPPMGWINSVRALAPAQRSAVLDINATCCRLQTACACRSDQGSGISSDPPLILGEIPQLQRFPPDNSVVMPRVPVWLPNSDGVARIEAAETEFWAMRRSSRGLQRMAGILASRRTHDVASGRVELTREFDLRSGSLESRRPGSVTIDGKGSNTGNR